MAKEVPGNQTEYQCNVVIDTLPKYMFIPIAQGIPIYCVNGTHGNDQEQSTNMFIDNPQIYGFGRVLMIFMILAQQWVDHNYTDEYYP